MKKIEEVNTKIEEGMLLTAAVIKNKKQTDGIFINVGMEEVPFDDFKEIMKELSTYPSEELTRTWEEGIAFALALVAGEESLDRYDWPFPDKEAFSIVTNEFLEEIDKSRYPFGKELSRTEYL